MAQFNADAIARIRKTVKAFEKSEANRKPVYYPQADLVFVVLNKDGGSGQPTYTARHAADDSVNLGTGLTPMQRVARYPASYICLSTTTAWADKGLGRFTSAGFELLVCLTEYLDAEECV